MDERVNACEIMKRENRRVAALSWGAGDNSPPPKPSRIPGLDPSAKIPSSENIVENTEIAPQTYIIAQNAAVLAQLMKDNENRTFNPSVYTTPASVFNTLAVDIDSSKKDPSPNDLQTISLRTAILPASELFKLNQTIDNRSNLQHQSEENLMNSILPPVYPIPCEIIDTVEPQMYSIDPVYEKPIEDICKDDSLPLNSSHCDNQIGKSIVLDERIKSRIEYDTNIGSKGCIEHLDTLQTNYYNSLTRRTNPKNEGFDFIPKDDHLIRSMHSNTFERGTRSCFSSENNEPKSINLQRRDKEQFIAYVNDMLKHNISQGIAETNYQGNHEKQYYNEIKKKKPLRGRNS